MPHLPSLMARHWCYVDFPHSSEEPGLIDCFRSLIFTLPRLGDLQGSVADLCPNGVSPRILPADLLPLSVASNLFLEAFFSCCPFTPRSLLDIRSEWPVKPRQPTSTGSQRAFQPLFRHSVLNFCVFGYLSLVGLFRLVYPGDSQFHDSNLFGGV